MSENGTASENNVAAMFRFLNEIGIIAQLSGTAFERVMPDTMTLPQFTVLNHLTRLGGDRTPPQIANVMQVSKCAMTNTLGHLERSGWISVRPDDRDGRSKRVDITETGRAAHGEAVKAITPELSWLSGVIAPERVREATPQKRCARHSTGAATDETAKAASSSKLSSSEESTVWMASSRRIATPSGAAVCIKQYFLQAGSCRMRFPFACH